MKVLLICEVCGKEFEVMPSRANGRKYCSPECYYRVSTLRLADTRTVWTSETAPRWNKGLTKETSPKVAAQARGQKSRKNPKLSEWIGIHGNNPRGKGYHHSLKALRNHSQARKLQWQDPDYRNKQLAAIMNGIKRKPTRTEIKLDSIISSHFPDFKYNGDGRLGVTLGGLIPDFVNVNGKKQVIEVFGDYFHSPEVIGNRWRGSELGKMMVYNSLGWKCLVIWEHELKELTEEQIVAKVVRFTNGNTRLKRLKIPG